MRVHGWIGRCCHRWMMGCISRKLELDSKQREKLDQLDQRLNGARHVVHGVGQHSHDELVDLLAGEQFDRSKAGELLQSQLNRLNEVGGELMEQLAEFIDTLQPYQRRKLRTHLQRRCCC